MITIANAGTVAPLEKVQAAAKNARAWKVFDGQGRVYAAGVGAEFVFTVSGALGHHVVAAFDENEHEVERTSFRVDCKSGIEDDSALFRHLLQQCMLACMQEIHGYQGGNHVQVHSLGERNCRGYLYTSRDHIHAHKAMRYFLDWNQEWIDAFCEYQREDGMVWDFLVRRPEREPAYFEYSGWGNEFFKVVANGDSVFARQPVMNDLEHMFIRGIWQTWRANGDDIWMASRLDNALRALQYATTSPYAWSEKLGLVHRPFCIDMWDFQSEYDAALVGGHTMMAIPGVSKYGATHGDSMGLAQACDELTAMLEHVGRTDDAERVKMIGSGLRKNLDKYCWNGEFFTHFIPEDPTFERPFGVDQSKQVSLSNAYALNRGISHEQAVAIIRTYQRLREETKDVAPGEWFCMYPPFPRGFGRHGMWHYVNGGVAPMVAGELAHGAFEHGFEDYGVDILDRVAQLGLKYERIPRVWRGMLPKTPERDFEMLDLRPFANTNFSGTAKTDAIPWSQEGENDLHEMPIGKREFQTIQFDVIDPAINKGASCVGISANAPYAPRLDVPVGRKAQTLYFLHTLWGGSGLAGALTIQYANGTTHRMCVRVGAHIQGWWIPKQEKSESLNDPTMLVAWRGANAKCPEVGVMVWGLENPHPDKKIEALTLDSGPDGARWMVLGITLSDKPIYLPPSGLSDGIPSVWSVGAVIWAMFEGLAGVYDAEPNFKTARICPRWAASDAREVTVTAKFEEGGGYIRYIYQRSASTLRLLIAGNSTSRQLEVLIPKGTTGRSVRVNGSSVPFNLRTIEKSTYACVELDGIGPHDVAIDERNV